MPKKEILEVRGKNLEITVYDDFDEIYTYIRENCRFHDAIMEIFGMFEDKGELGFSFYAYPERHYLLDFEGVTECSFSLDLKMVSMDELKVKKTDNGFITIVDGTPVHIESAKVKLSVW